MAWKLATPTRVYSVDSHICILDDHKRVCDGGSIERKDTGEVG